MLIAMLRRVTVCAVLLVSALFCGCKHSHPNVLIVTIDTCRADHLGCYGFRLAHTPVIDELSREGVLCTNAIAAAPITMPAHTSIFTGLFPPAHGVRDNGSYALGETAVTLAKVLQSAGYTTQAFVSALVLNRRYNLNQGFDTYDDDLWAEKEPALFMIRERRAPRTAERFLQWFDSWKVKREKPFFTWVHFFDPHQPYHPDPADMALAVSPYDAEIAGVDRQIGRMVDALRKAGVLDNTLLIVTADHGESLGEHGELTHAIFVYDATVRVPLILRAPWLLGPRVYNGPVRSVDIMPTVLDAVGVGIPRAIDGQSLLAAFQGKQSPPQIPQYSESLLSEVGFGMAPLFAIREEGYKYIRAPRPELYDLRRDPHELSNLVAANPRIAARLNADLTRLMDSSRAHAIKVGESPMSRETEESLQALGYLAPRSERSSMNGIDPKDGLPIHNMLEDARHFAQHGQWDEAEKRCLQVVALTPRNVSALNVLGLIGVKTGHPAKAEKYYRESLAIDPQQFRVYGVLGTLALLNGNFDEAIRDLRLSLAINPHFAEAMANIGFIESLRGDEVAAEAWYRRGVAADPTFPRVYRRLGDLDFERGDFARAYGYYERDIQILPSDMRATLQAGNCARRLGRAAEADALFRRAQQLRPESWVPVYNRACLLATTGQADAALQLLESLAARRPLSYELVERDPDLSSVRKLPGFSSLLQSLKKGAVDADVAEDAE